MTDTMKQQIEDIKKQIDEVKPIKVVKPQNKTADKAAYMKQYMREYTAKNKDRELARRNSCYYIKKYNIPKEFKQEFEIYTADCWKAITAIQNIKKNHPDLYPKLFKYI
mgnify:CR=1 FL=1